MVQAVIGTPGRRRSGAVDHRGADEQELDDGVQADRAMGESAMVSDGRSESANEQDRVSPPYDVPSGEREDREAGNRHDVNQADPEEGPSLAGMPSEPAPRPR